MPVILATKDTYYYVFTDENVAILTKKEADKLVVAFRKLRRCKVWKATFGIWTLEVTNIGNGYHPHINALCNQGCNIDDVRNRWQLLTGGKLIKGKVLQGVIVPADSKLKDGKIIRGKEQVVIKGGAQNVYIKHIKKHKREGIAQELLKYVVKISELDGEELETVMSVFARKKLLNVFGTEEMRKYMRQFNGDKPKASCCKLQVNEQSVSKAQDEWWKTCECGGKLLYDLSFGVKLNSDIMNLSDWHEFYKICPICGEHYLYYKGHTCPDTK